MSGQFNRFLPRFALTAVAAASLAGCGVNSIPTSEENAKAKWAEVQNQYQRRADLVPNLVATVKGYAKQEQDTLVKVTEARAKATSVQITAADLTDPDKVAAYQKAQGELSQGLGRLMANVEAYPDSSRTRTSSRCKASSKAPRTASPSRAATTTTRCSRTTPPSAPSRR